MIKYKITILNFLKQILSPLIGLVIIGAFLYYKSGDKNFEIEWFELVILFCIVSFYVLFPCLVIFNHYMYDKDTCMMIDEANRKFIYQYKNEKKEVLIADITLIKEIHIPILLYTFYSYQIYCKDGTSIYMSDLLMPELDVEFQDVNQEREDNYRDIFLHRK